jgi:hypothetical protein
MIQNGNELSLHINPSPNDDLEELAHLTQQLRKEILELDVDSVDFAAGGEVPKGSKSMGGIEPDVLLIHIGFLALGEVLHRLIPNIQLWLRRNEGRNGYKSRSITLDAGGDKVEVKGSFDQGHQGLINEWIHRQIEKSKK